ncbi:MAG TPA: hypothetical protein VET26_03165 [Candidatus Sulfotelmatobacter sp.]|nr:hypothetical protein [Candidatus Sulfotelmatobacter sp.]
MRPGTTRRSATKRRTVQITAALVAGALAACGQAAPKAITAAPVAGVSPSAHVVVGAGVVHPVPAFQGGVIVYADGNDPTLLPAATRLLDHLVTVKVNSVALAFPLYQSSWTSTDVHADASKTPSTAFLQGFIEQAHQRNLAVLLRPLIDDTPLMRSGHWRGQLQPTDLAAWFASYKAMMTSYASIAQTEGAEVLDIGTELNSLQTQTPQWLDLISTIRATYKGQLTYSSNWDAAYPAFGTALDFASVDAFFPLSAPNQASVAQLVGAWQQWTGKLSDLRSSLGKPVVLTELGTTSEVGSYRSPYNWQHGTGVSLEAQQRYYAASCQALKPLVSGMYWWVYYTNWFDKTVPASDPGYQPFGKPAEREITNCYR